MKRRTAKLAAPILALTLAAAACGGDGNPSAAPPDSSVGAAGDTSGAAPVSTAAADLRAGLTSLLQEHVYLAGAALATAVQAGGNMEAPAVEAAAGTLDANSVALSEAVASVYGDDAGNQFLELWRNHIGFFVDYTLGGATGDTAKQEQARQQLNDYRADFGAFIDSATDGELDAATVADSLQVHVNTVIAAIDAVLAGSPEVFASLREAAQHMPGTAAALADAIAAQSPDKFPR